MNTTEHLEKIKAKCQSLLDLPATFTTSSAKAGWRATIAAIEDWQSLYNVTECYADGSPDASTHEPLGERWRRFLALVFCEMRFPCWVPFSDQR